MNPDHNELIRRCALGDSNAARIVAAQAFADADARSERTLPRPPERRFHQIVDRSDLGEGRRVGRLGALIYLLDDGGDAVTAGHHELEMKDGVLYGRTGAMKEQIGLARATKRGA